MNNIKNTLRNIGDYSETYYCHEKVFAKISEKVKLEINLDFRGVFVVGLGFVS